MQALWWLGHQIPKVYRDCAALMESDKEKIRELAAALGQLLDQVAQMRGLFPDDDALDRAIDDAEKALELAQ